MIPILQRHAVQVLLSAGLTSARVSTLTGVAERSVRRIGQEPAITELATGAVARLVGRPSKVAEHEAFVVTTLTAEPEIKTVEVLHRLRGRGYTGAKSAVYELVASLRVKQASLLVRFDGLPGEFSQHDFGEVWVRFGNGRRRKVHFFASRLKYSRWVQVTIVPNAMCDSFFATLECELIDRRRFQTRREARTRGLPVHRGLVQPAPSPLRPGLPDPCRIREEVSSTCPGRVVR